MELQRVGQDLATEQQNIYWISKIVWKKWMQNIHLVILYYYNFIWEYFGYTGLNKMYYENYFHLLLFPMFNTAPRKWKMVPVTHICGSPCVSPYVSLGQLPKTFSSFSHIICLLPFPLLQDEKRVWEWACDNMGIEAMKPSGMCALWFGDSSSPEAACLVLENF